MCRGEKKQVDEGRQIIIFIVWAQPHIRLSLTARIVDRLGESGEVFSGAFMALFPKLSTASPNK